MTYYPILVDLTGRKVLVVGGGAVALRKIESLLECSAVVLLVSMDVDPALREYIDAGKVKYLGTRFNEEQIDDVFMVIAATDDSNLNRLVSRAAEERNILVNAVDQPDDCNFIVPAVVRKGDLLIAVSTSGRSPAMAAKIRKKLSGEFGIEYEYFLRMMGNIRKEVLAEGNSQEQNSRIFYELVESPVLEAIEKEDWERVSRLLSKILRRNITVNDVNNFIRG